MQKKKHQHKINSKCCVKASSCHGPRVFWAVCCGLSFAPHCQGSGLGSHLCVYLLNILTCHLSRMGTYLPSIINDSSPHYLRPQWSLIPHWTVVLLLSVIWFSCVLLLLLANVNLFLCIDYLYFGQFSFPVDPVRISMSEFEFGLGYCVDSHESLSVWRGV